METMGALHSFAAPRQSSKLIMSLSDVEYSRIRPQPVHVRLHVCSGSSCSTVANYFVPRNLCPITEAAIFAASGKGNLNRAMTVTRGAGKAMTRCNSQGVEADWDASSHPDWPER